MDVAARVDLPPQQRGVEARQGSRVGTVQDDGVEAHRGDGAGDGGHAMQPIGCRAGADPACGVGVAATRSASRPGRRDGGGPDGRAWRPGAAQVQAYGEHGPVLAHGRRGSVEPHGGGGATVEVADLLLGEGPAHLGVIHGSLLRADAGDPGE